MRTQRIDQQILMTDDETITAIKVPAGGTGQVRIKISQVVGDIKIWGENATIWEDGDTPVIFDLPLGPEAVVQITSGTLSSATIDLFGFITVVDPAAELNFGD